MAATVELTPAQLARLRELVPEGDRLRFLETLPPHASDSLLEYLTKQYERKIDDRNRTRKRNRA